MVDLVSNPEGVFNAGNREQCTYLARMAWVGCLYEDMARFMVRAIKLADEEGDDPSEEERNLLWEAYKGVVNGRREARKAILTAVDELQRASAMKGKVRGKDDVGERKTNSVSVQTGNDGDDGDAAGGQRTVIVSDEHNPIRHHSDDDSGIDDVADNADGATKSSIDTASSLQGKDTHLGLLLCYCNQIEKEILHLCDDFVKLLRNEVHPQDEESKVYFLKLKADHLRYMCEVQTGTLRIDTAEEVLKIYLAAQDIAKKILPARHPTRLGLALNFSVFYVDILESKEEAIKLSKEAIEEADEGADTKEHPRVLELFDDSLTKESERVLSFIRGNVKIWSTDDQEKDDKEDNIGR